MVWGRQLIAASVIFFLGLPGVASAADVLFTGKLKAGGGAIHFRLIDNGTKIQGWEWRDLPVRCLEGNDTNSSRYTSEINVKKDGSFRAQNVLDREGFTTNLQGVLTHHNTKASGRFSMSGPEPPSSTHCRGTSTWSTTLAEKATLDYVSGSSSVPQPGFFEDCPQKHPVVIGGGVRIDGSTGDENTGNLLIEGIAPVLPSDGSVDSWAGSAFKLGSQPASMTVTAICSNDESGFETRTERVQILGPGHDTGTAACPAGTHVVSGGVAFQGFDHRHFHVGVSRPADGSDPDSTTDDGWTATGINESTSSNAQMVITAICSADDTFRYVHSNSKTVLPHSEGSDQVACPSHTHVVGGGVDLKGNKPGLADSFPFDTNDPGSTPSNGWRGSAFNDNVVRQNMKVFAVCQDD